MPIFDPEYVESDRAAPEDHPTDRGQSDAGHPGARRGEPLDATARRKAELAYGTTFGDVRVHTDPHASRLAEANLASAVTVGSDIAFAPGAYQPGTVTGDLVIAHELAHTVQQRGAGSATARGGIDLATADIPGLEADADRSAAAFAVHDLAHQSARAAQPERRSGLRLQRCPVDAPKPAPGYKDVLADPGRASFGMVAAALAQRDLAVHGELIASRGYGSYTGTKASPSDPSWAPAPTALDCTTFVLKVLDDAFAAKGRSAEWARVRSQWKALSANMAKMSGIDLQRALQAELGWKAVFFAPDPRNPRDANPEHPFAYRKVLEQGTYYGIKVEAEKSVVGYRPTDATKTAATTELERLRRVPTGLLAVRGGMHMALLAYGKVYEVHWSKRADDTALVTATDLAAFEWQSGVVVMPPEDMVVAWR
jgi:hypothetical protein